MDKTIKVGIIATTEEQLKAALRRVLTTERDEDVERAELVGILEMLPEGAREALVVELPDFPFTLEALEACEEHDAVINAVRNAARVFAVGLWTGEAETEEDERKRKLYRSILLLSLAFEHLWIPRIAITCGDPLGMGGYDRLPTMAVSYVEERVFARHEPRPTFGGRRNKRDIYKRK